jgi:hypothetical protein
MPIVKNSGNRSRRDSKDRRAIEDLCKRYNSVAKRKRESEVANCPIPHTTNEESFVKGYCRCGTEIKKI